MKTESYFTEYENTKKEGAEPMDRSFEEWKKRMEEFRKFHCEGERLGVSPSSSLLKGGIRWIT